MALNILRESLGIPGRSFHPPMQLLVHRNALVSMDILAILWASVEELSLRTRKSRPYPQQFLILLQRTTARAGAFLRKTLLRR